METREAMRKVTYTKQVKLRYAFALLLCGAGIALIVVGYSLVGALIGGAAFGLAYITAQTNGHFAQFGKKDSKRGNGD